MDLKKEDYMLATHRGHGAVIGKGVDINAMMAEILEANGYTLTEDLTVYAVWAEPCRITFDAGQYGFFEEWVWNEETEVEETQPVATRTLTVGKGTRYCMAEATSPNPNDDSKKFIGWSLTSDGDPLSDDYYTITEDTTFYVVWADPCVITWDANGGYFTDWIEEEGNYTETQIPSRTDAAWAYPSARPGMRKKHPCGSFGQMSPGPCCCGPWCLPPPGRLRRNQTCSTHGWPTDISGNKAA